METIEKRIETAHLGGLAADVTRFYAISNLKSQVSDVWRVMGWKSTIGTGILQSDDLATATGQGLDAAAGFISNMRATMQFSPDRPSLIALEDIKESMGEELLRIAFHSAEQVIDRYPGLQQVMKEHGNYPESEWKEYAKQMALKGKARRMPDGLEMVMEFIRYVWHWEEQDKSGTHPDTWVRNPYNEAHLKKWPAMRDISDCFLTEKEQVAVKQVTNYGGGPDFIKKSTLF